jgi:carbonic anhydrase/acetyltransferase-like protein (isoleucine patch superfamily)
MLLEHLGKRPRIDPAAYVAPTAVVCGDVTVGEGTAVMFGAVLVAQGGSITVGRDAVILENAVLRGAKRHPLDLGDRVLVGPRASLSGCTVEAQAFLATGSTVFNGARVGGDAEVRVNGVVHVNSRVPEGTVVPIGWVAVGDPAEVLPPDAHDRIWEIQRDLDFPGTVFGISRPPAGRTGLADMAPRYARALRRHEGDRLIEER